MSGNLILHPEKGVNPRLGVCTRCGEEHSVILLGKWDRYFHCAECHTVTIGASHKHCGKCEGARGHFTPIGEFDRLPAGLCLVCETEVKEHDAIVAAGGVYWRCEDCQQSGVIRPNEFAAAVRATHGLTNGEPCGVTFDKTTCWACSK